MKYIKTYEKLSFKNYVIMSHSWLPNTLFICRPFNEDTKNKIGTRIDMMRIFQYDIPSSEFLEDGNIYYYSPTDKSTIILYQTDSLEDAKNSMKIIAHQKKFNI